MNGFPWRFSSPLLLLLGGGAFYHDSTLRDEMTRSVFLHKQAVAQLSAALLEEKLNGLINVGASLANRRDIRQSIAEEKWPETAGFLEGALKDFPFIERLVITDPQGTALAGYPLMPQVVGRNFAHRDWYQKISRDGQPYLSEVYQRFAPPRYNALAAAFPIKAEDGTVLGFLLLQVRLDALLAWNRQTPLGSTEFVFVVDPRGQLAAHPKFSPHAEIMDFSSLPAVQKALRGERGVGVTFNPVDKEKQIAAYEPVSRYGWGVVAAEPTRIACAGRQRVLRTLWVLYGVLAMIGGWFVFVLREDKHKKEIRELSQILKQSLSEDLSLAKRKKMALQGKSRVLPSPNPPQSVFHKTEK